MAKLKVEQEPFFMVKNAVVDSEELFTSNEKYLYMILCRYGETSFPSISTLSKKSGLCKRTVQNTLNTLQEKKVLKKVNRKDKNNGNMSNLYVLNMKSEIWKAKNIEELKEFAEETEIEKAVRILKQAGYEVTEKKEPSASAPTKVTEVEDSTKLTQEKYIVETEKSQEVEEKYPLEWLKNHYEYEQMLEECPEEQETIENVMQILHDSMNSSAKTVRVGRESKPKDVYVGKMMKLTSKGILYAIRKYKEAREPIGNVTNYMRTLLYRAEEQRHLDNLNKQAIQSNQQNQRNDQGESLPFGKESTQEMEAKAVPKPKPKEPMRKANRFNDFPQRNYSDDEIAELEKLLLRRPGNT